jgi:uncharacterized protein YdhG (YjbR/CyaY superfamily)
MKFSSVDEYIESFPADVREALEEVRRAVRAVVPAAGEKISYDIPTITLDGKPLLHFSGWKHHIALYPVPPVDDALAAALDQYRSGKSTLKFPLAKPIPYALITRVTQAFITARR